MDAHAISGLNNIEIPKIIELAAKNGTNHLRVVPVRLPHAVYPLFEKWLKHFFPEKREDGENHQSNQNNQREELE